MGDARSAPVVTDGGDDGSAWATTTAFGLALVGATLLVSSAHLLLVDALRGPVVVLPAIGVVCLGAALLARRGTRRSLLAALVVALLVLLANLGHLVDTLGLPASPWDFVPNLAAAVGLAVAIPSAIAALRGRHAASGAQRTIAGGALAVVALGTAASLVLAAGAGDDAPAGAVVVETVDNEFAPTDVAVAGGDVVALRNLDPYGHTFTVEALGVDLGVAGDDTATVTIPPSAAAGSHAVTCVLHPEIMVGTLTVTES